MKQSIIEDNAIVLFQGDSVTDVSRNREENIDLGKGYAMIASALFSSLYPEKQVRFINKGISGSRVKDLQGRWEEDCLNLNPTWVSILIGINDCWRRYDKNDPTSIEEFEAGYRDILTRTRENLDARIILCEPFVLQEPKDRQAWREDLDPKIQVVRKLSKEFDALYIPFDGLFAQAASRCDSTFWSLDGVHPTLAGHGLMAKAWLKAINAI